MGDKMRVHILAKELSVTSKAILAKCRAEGLSVKNHMSTLMAGQEATLREWFSEGAHAMTVEVADRVNLEKVRAKPRKRKAKAVAVVEAATITADAVPPADVGPALEVPPLAPAEEVAVVAAEAPPTVEADVPVLVEVGPPVPDEVAGPAAEAPVGPVVVEPAVPVTAAEDEGEAMAPRAVAEAPSKTPEVVTPLVDESAPAVDLVEPAGPQNVPKPARLQGPRVVRYEAPETNVYPPSRSRTAAGGEGRAPTVPVPGAPGQGPSRRGPEGRGGVRQRPHGRRRGGHSARDAVELVREWRDRDLIERRERLAGATGRRIHTRRIESRKGVSAPSQAVRKTEVGIQEPIILKDLCATIGVPFLQLFKILDREHNLRCSINSILDKETAELVAADFGMALTVVEAKTSLDVLKEEFANRERKHPKPRPPVVTILGHVDHGKTSLLDRIRRTRVTAGEDGGITQHIGAYRVETASGPVTFVDTPGHEAFTAMRARGANLTDIAVLVVAADDGVMPQTREAINHAKAADVPIVVALNKIDLGRDKEVEIYGQLASADLTPSGEWGGQTDVIATSATTGEGIDELLEHLVALGEVLELQADATVEAQGVVIEAETKEGVGPVARLLVQEGTLKKGQIVVCGNAAGKVRSLRDDTGRAVKSTGPAMPVEVWGLEDVPMAGDRLYQVDSMHRAKEIAEEVAQRRLVEARAASRTGRSLEALFKQRDEEDISELNLIIKADVEGSVEVLRHSLGQIPSDQIRLNIRHAGVGAVNDSDIVLADASNAIIIAFRVVAQPRANKAAESKLVDVRYYRVVYEVVDDIIKAMEGKLPPIQQIESRATAEVRNVFKISKVGWVAGCMISNGVIARNHKVRVVRDGTVVREDCDIESLRHFKDDVKDVRAGLECGIRLVGFNDVKVGDVIESYEVIEVARTL